MKRVKQISIDILVDEEVNGECLAKQAEGLFEGKVLGSAFIDDITEMYIKSYMKK